MLFSQLQLIGGVGNSNASCELHREYIAMACLDYRLVSRPELLDLVDEAWARDSLPDDGECKCRVQLATGEPWLMSAAWIHCKQRYLSRENRKMLP